MIIEVRLKFAPIEASNNYEWSHFYRTYFESRPLVFHSHLRKVSTDNLTTFYKLSKQQSSTIIFHHPAHSTKVLAPILSNLKVFCKLILQVYN